MIETFATSETLELLLHQLNMLLEQELRFQPKLLGLRLIESAPDNRLRMTAKLRDFEVKDLLSLIHFFGFSTETFSLCVNYLDRFLSKMKVQPKHLGCVGLSCFYLAAKATEEERNIPLPADLIRVSQYRFTVSDLMRMEGILLDKLCGQPKVTTAFQFLQLYHSVLHNNQNNEREKHLSFERLESQLKACHCRIVFSKAKPSVLALSIIAVEAEEKLLELVEAVECFRVHSKINGRELYFWKELVSKCLVEYSSSKCSKPNAQKLKWIVSSRTARQLKHSYYRIAHLPAIPETGFSTGLKSTSYHRESLGSLCQNQNSMTLWPHTVYLLVQQLPEQHVALGQFVSLGFLKRIVNDVSSLNKLKYVSFSCA